MEKSFIVRKREGKMISENPEWIELKDITMTTVETKNGKSSIILHTKESEYIYCTLVDDIAHMLEQEHGIFSTRRGVVVNLNHDFTLDKKEHRIKIYSKIVTIAASKFAAIKKYLEGNKWFVNN